MLNVKNMEPNIQPGGHPIMYPLCFLSWLLTIVGIGLGFIDSAREMFVYCLPFLQVLILCLGGAASYFTIRAAHKKIKK